MLNFPETIPLWPEGAPLPTADAMLCLLTPEQLAVCRAAVNARSITDVAERLGISIHSTQKRIRNARRALRCSSLTLLLSAMQHRGLLDTSAREGQP